MSFLDAVDTFMRDISDLSGAGVRNMIDIETVIDDQTFALKDGSLSTLVRIRGHRMMVGPDEFVAGREGMTSGFNGTLKQSGHSMIFHYRYSPDDKSVVSRSVNAMKNTAKAIKLDLDDVLDDWGNAINGYVHGESIYVSLVTRVGILNRQTGAESKKAMSKADRDNTFKGELAETQRINHFSEVLVDQHRAYVDSIMQILESNRVSVIAEIVPVREALHNMRKTVSPNETGVDWTPSLPGDVLPIRLRDTEDSFVPDFIRYKSIALQLFGPDRDMPDAKTVRWGNVYHRAISIDVPPLGATSFNRLFEKVRPADFAWNLSFHLDGDGMNAISFKSMIATLLMPLSAVNRQIHNAEKWLRHLSENDGDAIVRLRMTARIEAKSIDILNRGVSEFIESLHSWESCEATVPLGAAQAVACGCTVPGMLSKSPSPAAAAPLGDVISFLPWTRPADIWDTGMLFRTNDGRAFPWLQGSSRQTAFIDVGLGPMGTGKSVNLNAINFGFLLTPGLVRLPMLSILDIGPSSSGLITTIQDALPPDQKYLATYVRLRMDPERFAVNLFDLPIGATKPLPSHMSFLINFLVLLQTPLGSGGNVPSPPSYAQAISRTIIERAYSEMENERNPRIYRPNSNPTAPDCVHIDETVKELGIYDDGHITWIDLVKIFFDKGMIREAEIAQRYAVPTLPEVVARINDHSVRGDYEEDDIRNYRNAVINAIKEYPIIGQATRFSLSEARIVSLDLDEVAIKGSPLADRQSGVMFMLARHLLISRFFVQETDVVLMPSHYQEYHSEKIKSIRLDPKRVVFDELHRFIKKDNPSVSAQVISDVGTIQRESRKWNLHVGLYSQEPTDIPMDLAGLTTSVFIMGVNGSDKVAERADDLFSFGDTAKNAMIRSLKKPGRAGSHMIARMLVDGQPVTRHLMNTLGPILMWSLSSTTEDSTLAKRLYAVLGSRIARRALARLYPGGSIKGLYEQMKEAYSEGRYLSNEDRDIYERLERQTDKQVDTLDVIYEKVITWVDRQRDSGATGWA